MFTKTTAANVSTDKIVAISQAVHRAHELSQVLAVVLSTKHIPNMKKTTLIHRWNHTLVV